MYLGTAALCQRVARFRIVFRDSLLLGGIHWGSHLLDKYLPRAFYRPGALLGAGSIAIRGASYQDLVVGEKFGKK